MQLDDNQRKAVEKLYMEMYNALSVYARSALHDHILAEEAVQDTFRIACSKVNDFLSSPNPKGWLLNKHLLSVILLCRFELVLCV